MKKLCILTYGRTGSTALIAAGQENFKNTKSPDQSYRRIFSVSEIFDPSYLEKSYDCQNDEGFMRPYANRLSHRSNKSQYLAQFVAIAEEHSAAVFMCKIVIGSQEMLDELGNYIEAMEDFKFVFLTRNVIDVYFSIKKATELKSWSHTDTTAIKVDLDLDELYSLDNWCNDCVSVCSKSCNPLVLDYKEIFYEGVCNIDAYNRMLNGCFGDSIQYLRDEDVFGMLQKQDKNMNFRNSLRSVN